MATPLLAKIGILSIGDMGMGIAKLLVANGFAAATNCKGRSTHTIERAKSASVEIYKSDEEFAGACDVILSVVPPRDAMATAQRIADAVTGPFFSRTGGDTEKKKTLYFADLNAVAPCTVKSIAALFDDVNSNSTKRPGQNQGVEIRFIDGAIIGNPPSLKQKTDSQTQTQPTTSSSPSSSPPSTTTNLSWSVPNIPTSGPWDLSSIPIYGARLAAALNTRHISDQVGSASGLKMCFASLSKGFTALAIESFTTAHRLGVLDELRAEMRHHMPERLHVAERGVVGMAPKAYRWVREMEEIALTFNLASSGGDAEGSSRGGGGGGGFPPDLFNAIADVYRIVAEDTVLGAEKVGSRKRGLDVHDMAAAVAEGLEKKRKKND